MKILFAEEELCYTGAELCSHFLRRHFGLSGDAAVAFLGPCAVPLERMVDLEDVERRSPIAARLMLHLLVEHFDRDLALGIARQRLLAALAAEEVGARTAERVRRRGDDLYVGERKLSVSICTSTPVSTVIHLGLNVDPSGAPVPAVGLLELNVDPRDLGRRLLERYQDEIAGLAAARAKVRSVS
jgi:hypothetical protein